MTIKFYRFKSTPRVSTWNGPERWYASNSEYPPEECIDGIFLNKHEYNFVLERLKNAGFKPVEENRFGTYGDGYGHLYLRFRNSIFPFVHNKAEEIRFMLWASGGLEI